MIARPRVESYPALWDVLRRCLAVEPPLARRWWQALARSPRSCCAAISTAVLLGDTESTLLDPLHVLHVHTSPAKLIACLEDLHTLGTLTRRDVTTLEERILTHTTPEGRWQPVHHEGTAI